MSYLGNPLVTSAFVTDQYNGTGSQTAFTMSVAPANTASILVNISGVTQDPTTYSVNGLTLTFSSAPPSGTANISVRYLGIPAAGIVNTAYRTVTEFTATANQKTFTVPSYSVNNISVFKNGVRLGTADFTATDGVTVTLIIGAAAGDLVTTESFYVSSVLGAIPAIAGAVTNPYILDGAVSQSKLGANVAGNGPAFNAYRASTNQTGITSGTWTKVQFNTKDYDTTNAYDATTNYRFQPLVSGYYQVNAMLDIYASTSNITNTAISIYKNGIEHKRGNGGSYTSSEIFSNVSAIVYLNGSTDYIEIYFNATSVGSISINAAANAQSQYFQAVLVRAA